LKSDDLQSAEALSVRIEQLESELKARDELLRAVIMGHPDAVVISDLKGQLTSNPEVERIFGQQGGSLEPGDWATELFKPDMQTPYPLEQMPLMRALRGEECKDLAMYYRPKGSRRGVWITVSARPLRDAQGEVTGAVSVFRDVTERKSLEDDLASRNNQLASSEREKTELIERLRAAVEELSTPVLELWDDVLALPVVGVVDSHRSAEMTERLLAETERSQARFVIVDLTGVEIVDTATADRLLKLVTSVELLGARCFVTGIQPAVAQTIVELGLEFGQLKALRNLKHALKLSMALAARDEDTL
jgi:rsbT co-antagonist protein RsbR